jgi:hypothetical protein
MHHKIFYGLIFVVLIMCTGPLSAQVTVPGTAATLQQAFSTVSPGQTITVLQDIEEDIQINTGLSGVTLQGATPGVRVRRTRFIISGSNFTIRDIILDGKNLAGERSESVSHRSIVTVSPIASNFLMENCGVVNPASGEGNGIVYVLPNTFPDILNNPGACVNVQTSNNITIRNCSMVNDPDTGVDNEVCIFFANATAGSGPVLIENCTFMANSRLIQINVPHANMNIRNNLFMDTDATSDYEGGGVFLMTDYNPLGDANGPEGIPMRNLVIEGNTFGDPTSGRAFSNSGVAIDGPIDGVYVRNNLFTASMTDEAIYSKAYGQDLVFSGNTVYSQCAGHFGAFRAAARSSQLEIGDTRLQLKGCVIRDNIFQDNIDSANSGDGRAVGFGELCSDVVFEDNEVIRAGRYGYWNSIKPHTAVIRRNLFSDCGHQAGPGGDVDIQGAILLQADECSIVNNDIIDCYNGVTFDEATDVTQQVATDNRGTYNDVIAFNYILGAANNGIGEFSGISVHSSTTDRAAGLRFFNNTIAFPGAAAIFLRSPSVYAYNNIFHAGARAINIEEDSSNHNVTFVARGFNLNFNNIYGGISAMPTDITANPDFVGGLVPTTVSGMALNPGSSAINAGSTNGVVPDYVTEIGAWQQGQVDTEVPSYKWSLYR